MPGECALLRNLSPSLYDIEETLALYAEALQDVETQDAAERFRDEIGAALLRARDKRDAVAAFLRACEVQECFADEEIERLKARKARIMNMRAHLEGYVISVIQRFAPAGRNGIRRLEGNTSTLRVQKNPDSVSITSAADVPAMFKDVVLTMPAYVWEALLGALPIGDRIEFERRVRKREFRPDKKALAAELKAGTAIDGAELSPPCYRLVIS